MARRRGEPPGGRILVPRRELASGGGVVEAVAFRQDFLQVDRRGVVGYRNQRIHSVANEANEVLSIHVLAAHDLVGTIERVLTHDQPRGLSRPGQDVFLVPRPRRCILGCFCLNDGRWCASDPGAELCRVGTPQIVEPARFRAETEMILDLRGLLGPQTDTE